MTTSSHHPDTVAVRCRRCGKSGRIPRGVRGPGQLVFCSRGCERLHHEEMRIARRARQAAQKERDRMAHAALIARTPLHEVYPRMLDVMAAVQEQRPSYHRWAAKTHQRVNSRRKSRR